MKLIHFSYTPVKKVHSTKQDVGADVYAPKPRGLWVSDEDDHGWKAWCESEDFRTYSLEHEHEVELSSDANILYIRTDSELDLFSKKYQKEMPWDTRMIMAIDWEAVSKIYQGIIITPYLCNRRLDSLHFWYYGWDCASGCIWDAKAIKSIKVLEKVK